MISYIKIDVTQKTLDGEKHFTSAVTKASAACLALPASRSNTGSTRAEEIFFYSCPCLSILVYSIYVYLSASKYVTYVRPASNTLQEIIWWLLVFCITGNLNNGQTHTHTFSVFLVYHTPGSMFSSGENRKPMRVDLIMTLQTKFYWRLLRY